MNLTLIPDPNGVWPIKARSENGDFLFTGSFQTERVQHELLHSRLAKTLKLILILIAVAGAASIVLHVAGNLSRLSLGLIFEKSPLNLIFWISVLCDLYLWARVSQDRIDEGLLNILTIEQLASQDSEKMADVYALFNAGARKAWNSSLEVARRHGKQQPLGTHLFISLLEDKQIKTVFARLGVDTRDIATLLTNYIRLTEPRNEINLDKIPFTALSESLKLHNKTIDTTMLLCALAIELPQEHIVQDVLFNVGLDLQTLEIISSWIFTMAIWAEDLQLFHKLVKFKPDNEVNQGLTAVPTPYLDQFSTDLTRQAKYGQLPLAWGRAHDLEELFSQLQEGRQSVIIKGYEGTGRTTLINELAYKMAAEQVPPSLQDKRLVRLELSGILGVPQRAENVFMHAIEEAARSGNIVLVIEDIHQLARTQTSQGLSMLELLVNYMEGASLQMFATTSLEDYTDYLQKSQNFEQVFTSFELPALSQSGIMLACCTRASMLEFQNKCFFRYQAIAEAVKLSDSYIKGGGQPQKAINLLVEAANRAKNKPSPRIVNEDMIQKIISEKTHIPAQTLSESETDKLLNLETELKKGLIGQSPAVTAVAEALRRARSGLVSANRPIASFLFLGPTGVGKTELAKQLASTYFGESKFLLRLDMSEFRGADGLTKLLGRDTDKTDTPLIKHLKNYPFCLLLCDEFEKASSEIHNLFLQILEDGRLTTSKGETLDLTHTMVIATSNAGTKDIQEGIAAHRTMDQIKAALFNQTLTSFFPPELINRFDGVILFSPLNEQEIEKITYLQLEYLKKELLEKGIKVTFTDAVVKDIGQNAFDPQFGARPIRRYIQDHLESFIAKLLLSKKFSRGSELRIDIQNGQYLLG